MNSLRSIAYSGNGAENLRKTEGSNQGHGNLRLIKNWNGDWSMFLVLDQSRIVDAVG
jgi:hypothetical protein